MPIKICCENIADVTFFKNCPNKQISLNQMFNCNILNWNRAVIGAMPMPISLSQTVNEMEAMACQKVVQFAKDLGLQKVVIKGDLLVNALSQGLGCLCSYGNVIDDILVLADDFQWCEFHHVKRICNVVADMLAKKAKDLSGVWVWLDDLLEDIQPLVLFDVH